MRYLKTSEAAALLNVSPNTLRAWERRFGFPKPQRSPGKHRLFTYTDVAALKGALEEGLAISSAVARARNREGSEAAELSQALAMFDDLGAEAVVTAQLANRSLQEVVEHVVLEAVDDLEEREDAMSTLAHAFAASWAADWINRVKRLTPRRWRPGLVLISDASSGSRWDGLSPRILAVDLFLGRLGMQALILPRDDYGELRAAFPDEPPNLVVIAGNRLGDADVSRWVYATRLAFGEMPVALFDGKAEDSGAAQGLGCVRLSGSPFTAAAEILDHLGRFQSMGAAEREGDTASHLGLRRG